MLACTNIVLYTYLVVWIVLVLWAAFRSAAANRLLLATSITEDVKCVKNIKFFMYKVKANFNPQSTLTTPDLTLKYVTNNGLKVYATADTLFNVNTVDEDVVQTIEKAAQKHWPLISKVKRKYVKSKRKRKESIREWQVALQVSEHLLRPLCSEAMVLESSYGKRIRKAKTSGMKAELLGIGLPSTWYGVPDMQVRGTPVVVGSEPEENHTVEERAGSEEEEGEEADAEEEGSEGERADAKEDDDTSDTERYDTSDGGPEGVKVKKSSPSKGASTVVGGQSDDMP